MVLLFDDKIARTMLALAFLALLAVQINAAPATGNADVQAVALDDPPKSNGLTITKIAHEGPGCPDKSAAVVKYLDKSTVTIIFDKFQTLNVPGQTGKLTSVSCDFTIDFASSWRYKQAVATERVRGVALVPRNATSELTAHTKWTWEEQVLLEVRTTD